MLCLATGPQVLFVMFASFHPQYFNSDCQNKIERGEGVRILEKRGEKGEGGEVARLAAEKGAEEGEEKGRSDTRESERY